MTICKEKEVPYTITCGTTIQLWKTNMEDKGVGTKEIKGIKKHFYI